MCQGYSKDQVLLKYRQPKPGDPPVPTIDPESELYFLYEEEEEAYQKAKKEKTPWIGILKPLFKAIGWLGSGEDTADEFPDKPVPVAQSTKVARKNRSKGLFEPE